MRVLAIAFSRCFFPWVFKLVLIALKIFSFMKQLQSFLIKFTLFFCWFISFAAINFEGSNWGLQVGWIGAFLFCLSYMPRIFFKKSERRLFKRKTFQVGKRIFLVIFGFTGMAWMCNWSGLISLTDPTMMTRSLGHTGYLFFYFFVFVCIYHFLASKGQDYWIYFDWFLFYPFIFIAVWGVYQNVTTYDVLEYWTIFNNNLSTGFTYERFNFAHRVSSIFPEPSEYSYYLACVAPLVWAYFRNYLKHRHSTGMRWFVLLLWISQAGMVKSLSFFVALPFVAFVCLRHIEQIKGWKIIKWYVISSFILIGLVGLGLGDRLSEASSGSDGSSIARYNVLMESIDVFQLSPYIGFGYGVVRGMDAISFSLACFGVLGTLAFGWAIKDFILKIKSRVSPVMAGSFICLIAGCVLANNVLDNICIWVYLAVIAAAPKFSVIDNRRKVISSRESRRKVMSSLVTK